MAGWTRLQTDCYLGCGGRFYLTKDLGTSCSCRSSWRPDQRAGNQGLCVFDVGSGELSGRGVYFLERKGTNWGFRFRHYHHMIFTISGREVKGSVRGRSPTGPLMIAIPSNSFLTTNRVDRAGSQGGQLVYRQEVLNLWKDGDSILR